MGITVLDTIILLTGPLERPILASALCAQNSRLTVQAVETLAELTAVSDQVLRCARLIAFVSPVLVPARVLDRLGHGAYNFHPGPPEFPGWATSQFAIYHRATEFGATAHRMIEQVDAGPIVGVERFCIPANIVVDDLEKLAYAQLAKIFRRLATALATQSEPLAELPIRWSGQKSTRRQYAALCDIPLDISRQELQRRIKAFGGNHFGVMPTIDLHGSQFKFVPNEVCALPAHTETINQSTAGGRIKQNHAA
jgi:methionyl-tRNA formyltransferase